MAVDIFLRLDGVEGESTAKGHAKEIDVVAFGWGLSRAGSPATRSGAAAGKAAFEDLEVVKRLDKASPRLFEACASGKHFPEAVLTARKAGGGQQDYLVIRLRDVLVTSYELDGSEDEDGGFVDLLALAFSQVELEYTPTDKAGKALVPVTAGWDLKKNVKA